MKLFRYTVTGIGGFPTDMLRYDAAWPNSPDSVQNIHDIPEVRAKRREVQLTSIQEPTIGRWNSFMWQVNDVRKITIT
jgi:hypothetical protein